MSELKLSDMISCSSLYVTFHQTALKHWQRPSAKPQIFTDPQEPSLIFNDLKTLQENTALHPWKHELNTTTPFHTHSLTVLLFVHACFLTPLLSSVGPSAALAPSGGWMPKPPQISSSWTWVSACWTAAAPTWSARPSSCWGQMVSTAWMTRYRELRTANQMLTAPVSTQDQTIHHSVTLISYFGCICVGYDSANVRLLSWRRSFSPDADWCWSQSGCSGMDHQLLS